MSSFIETVTLAVTSPNNDTRQANELKLIEYRQKESNQFLVDCMNHISDDKTDPSIKQAIATLVGVSFRSEMVF